MDLFKGLFEAEFLPPFFLWGLETGDRWWQRMASFGVCKWPHPLTPSSWEGRFSHHHHLWVLQQTLGEESCPHCFTALSLEWFYSSGGLSPGDFLCPWAFQGPKCTVLISE